MYFASLFIWVEKMETNSVFTVLIFKKMIAIILHWFYFFIDIYYDFFSSNLTFHISTWNNKGRHKTGFQYCKLVWIITGRILEIVSLLLLQK